MVVNSDFRHDARAQKEALSLTRAGYSVTVFSLAMTGPPEQCFKGIRLLNPATGRLARFPYRISCLRSWWQVMRALLQEKGDVWHAHDLETLPFVFIASKLRGGKTVYDSHELWQGYDWPGRGGRWRAARRLVWKGWLYLEKVLAKRCHLVIAVNESCAAEMARLLRVQTPLVLRNCVDPAGDPDGAGGLRERLGIARGEALAVYSGHLKEGRGLENLLEAWAGVPCRAALAFVGYGPLEVKLRQVVQSARLKNVHFLPAVQAWELPEFICGASLGLVLTEESDLNSRFSLPNKLFEYTAAGVPVLASDLPEIRRLVTKYDTGVLVDPRDRGGVRRFLTELLCDGERLARLRQNVLKAREILTWQQEVKGLINEYSKITGGIRE
ncbi:glycosyltransferase [Pelotomaculum thermopropionicum SI]|uniref:Glycosyltransferase n=1 Tax=Pelotomaculum thermopropionicum (strain DSM 13744 / JCM 10971 / SI) TaxID=370438 RepID=A5D384_PELTS|nr:glycosyltransferase [Pelotomaculum thermopropionicum SI]